MQDDGDILETVPLSKSYALEILRVQNAHSPAIWLRLRHVTADGKVVRRGGFRVFADRLGATISALVRARGAVE